MTGRPAKPYLQPLLDRIAHRVPDVRLSAFDGSASGPENAETEITIRSPAALLNLIRAPFGLGLARAWVSGQIDLAGDIRRLAEQEKGLIDRSLVASALLGTIRTLPRAGWKAWAQTGPTTVEFRGRRPGKHTVPSDLREVEFHYGRTTEFYRHLLGPSMTYSCGIFAGESDTLEQAQERKHQLICDKLRLGPQTELLDIGCGWGSLLRFATARHECRGVGITASATQHLYNVQQSTERLEFLHADYRAALAARRATAVASVGMYEHVGAGRSAQFFAMVRGCLPGGGRFLNQAIVRRTSPKSFRRNSFVQRYIFPNGQLISLPDQINDLEANGFRVLSVETFGDSYATTLRHWVSNLEKNWDACVAVESEPRVRAWHLYLIGSMRRFEDRSIDLAQVLCEAV